MTGTKFQNLPPLALPLVYDSFMFRLFPSVIAITLLIGALPALAQKTAIGNNANRPFSQGIIYGDTLYVAGMTGGKDGKIPEKFEDEVKQTLENINVVLKDAGISFADAVSVQVYLTDMELFGRMNAVYTTYFPEPRPTRTTVGIAKLVGTAKIEITVTARSAALGKAKKKKK
ncbi:MAG: RidA family protein [Acidobacteria bacterium]|nr:RidA family protein [Acidobacteriota bacterium]